MESRLEVPADVCERAISSSFVLTTTLVFVKEWAGKIVSFLLKEDLEILIVYCSRGLATEGSKGFV